MKKVIAALAIALAITGCVPLPAPQLPTRNFASADHAIAERPTQISYADFKERFDLMRELGKEARKNRTPAKEAHDIAITAADQLIAQDSNAHYQEMKGETSTDYFSSDEKNALLKGYMESFFSGYNGK